MQSKHKRGIEKKKKKNQPKPLQDWEHRKNRATGDVSALHLPLTQAVAALYPVNTDPRVLASLLWRSAVLLKLSNHPLTVIFLLMG